MAFEINMQRDRGWFEVRYSGTITVAEREEAARRVFAVAEVTGFRRVLVDFRHAENAMDAFEASNRFASLLARETVAQNGRIAYVVGAGHQPNRAVDMLADARHVPCRRFDDLELAIAWLEADPPGAAAPDAAPTHSADGNPS